MGVISGNHRQKNRNDSFLTYAGDTSPFMSELVKFLQSAKNQKHILEISDSI